MALAIVFLFLATFLSTSHANSNCFNPIQLPRQHSDDDLDCRSWHLAVETNNLQGWKTVPKSCGAYVRKYMTGIEPRLSPPTGKQYRNDLKVVVDVAIEYATGLKIAGDGKDVWVFDDDETTLSNINYYARPDVAFGTKPYNSTKFNEYVANGIATQVPEVLRLYNTLLSLGIKTVFISGLREKHEEIRAYNLNRAGYYNWEKLILKGEDEHWDTSLEYKSNKRTQLVDEGYRIVGNIGDQWSDLLGPNAGERTFKVPNPMYYVV